LPGASIPQHLGGIAATGREHFGSMTCAALPMPSSLRSLRRLPSRAGRRRAARNDANPPMNRLSIYLVRLFSRDTLALFGVMAGLLFLIQCLKIFDVVVVQGQDLGTLFGQAALSMPPLAIVIGYVCMGIGMVRAFGGLQASHELHIIHANRQLPSLFGGVAIFALGGALIILLTSNFIEPWANRRLNTWTAAVAADVVGRTLRPHHFNQVVPGISVVIGGRKTGGNITNFFADDRRDPKMRRTYSASTARIGTTPNGYVLELHDGTLQYLSAKGDFSQVSFKSYEIALDRLTRSGPGHDTLDEHTTAQLVAAALSTHNWSEGTLHALFDRLAEGLRAIAMCVFMASLCAFPNARRRRARFPLELVPLLAAYADKTITSNFAGPTPPALLEGPAVVLLAGVVILMFRLKIFRPVPKLSRAAA
jgi:lipopolysaccharide export system permease protein